MGVGHGETSCAAANYMSNPEHRRGASYYRQGLTFTLSRISGKFHASLRQWRLRWMLCKAGSTPK